RLFKFKKHRAELWQSSRTVNFEPFQLTLRKIFFMVKKILLGILVLILAIVGYYVYMFTRGGRGGDSGPKQPALALKQHSDAFNKSIDATMNAYFEMKAAFVEGDTA